MEDTITIVHKQETTQGSCYVCKKSKEEEKRRRENNNETKLRRGTKQKHSIVSSSLQYCL